MRMRLRLTHAQGDLQCLFHLLEDAWLEFSQASDQAAFSNCPHLSGEYHRVLAEPTLGCAHSHVAGVELEHMSGICQRADHDDRTVKIDRVPRDDHNLARARLLRALLGVEPHQIDLTTAWCGRSHGSRLPLHLRSDASLSLRASQSEWVNSSSSWSCL